MNVVLVVGAAACLGTGLYLTRGRARLVVCALGAAVVVLGYLQLRTVHDARDAERERRFRHCDYAADDLENLAMVAVFPKRDGSEIDPEATRMARRKLDVDFVGHYIAELAFCVGWDRMAACEKAVWNSIALDAAPEAIAHDLRFVAAALRDGAACP